MRPSNSLLFRNIGEKVLRLSSDKLWETALNSWKMQCITGRTYDRIHVHSHRLYGQPSRSACRYLPIGPYAVNWRRSRIFLYLATTNS